MTFRRVPVFLATVVLMGWCASLQANADRPLTLIVPFPPTGTPDIYGTPRITKMVKLVQTLSTPSLTDALAQQVAAGLAAALEQGVLVERKSGGMTVDAAQYVARAAPDGHTLLLAGNPTFTIYPSLFNQPGFDPRRDLVPVAHLAEMPIALVSEAGNRARTVKAVLERVRLVPGQVNFAALGEGTTAHFASEVFRRMTGTQIVRVGYNGSTAALNAVATRNVEFGFVPLTGVLPYFGGGKIKLIAIGSTRRHASVPEIPTIAESGVDGYAAGGWFGLFAAAHTPRSMVSLLNHNVNRVAAEDVWQRMMVARGLFAAITGPEEFRTLVERDAVYSSMFLNAATTR